MMPATSVFFLLTKPLLVKLLWTKVPISGGYNLILKFFNYESTSMILV